MADVSDRWYSMNLQRLEAQAAQAIGTAEYSTRTFWPLFKSD